MEESPEPAEEQEVGLVGVATVAGALVGFALGSPYEGLQQSLVVGVGALFGAAVGWFVFRPKPPTT
jgi:hypothetical protein